MRKASVAGAFYPNSCDEIKKYFELFSKTLDEQIEENDKLYTLKPRAIISPHAGYIYSGFTANIAYRILKNSNPKRVIVIGPSHRVYLNGISVTNEDSYESPCGKLDIDLDYLEDLTKKFDLQNIKEAYEQEHSTEVQMPFIKYYIPNAKIIELIYGDIEYSTLASLMEYVLKDEENVAVISTDLSHFYDLKKANMLDNICLKAIANLDINEFEQGCEACGATGVKAILKCAKKMKLKSLLLDYRTSADASKDESRVVGYMSGLFY
ncbi:MAG: AmmeMemoRadiSam system protein B [Sulfurospirillum sp.]